MAPLRTTCGALNPPGFACVEVMDLRGAEYAVKGMDGKCVLLCSSKTSHAHDKRN